MAGFRQLLLPWDRQPQEAFDVNSEHPLASRVIGLWVGSQPGYLAGHGALTSSGVTQTVTPAGVGSGGTTYAGSAIVSLPNNNRFRLVGIDASIVAGVAAVDSGNNVYQHIWAVRDGGTQIAVFAVGRDTANYLGGRVAISVAGSDFVGTSGSARYGQNAVYGASWGSSGRTLYVDGAVDSTSANTGVVASSSIVPSLLNRQSGGRGLVGPATFVYLFDGYIGDYWHAEIARNPWQLFEPRRIWVPQAGAGGGASTIAVPAGSLSLTGFAPTVTASANQAIAVPSASLSLTSFAPTVLSSRLVQVPAAALTLTAYAPTVTATANRFINPPAAALTLTGFAPSVLAGGGAVVQVPAAGLTLTGHVPTVTATANQAIAVPAGSLTLTGYAPSVLSGTTVFVPAGSLTLTSFAPSVVTTANSLVSVPAAALALTGYAPTVSNGVSAIPTMPPYITVWMWVRTA